MNRPLLNAKVLSQHLRPEKDPASLKHQQFVESAPEYREAVCVF
jgi:hypothetical protein